MSEDTINGEIALLLQQVEDSAALMHTWANKLYRQAAELRGIAKGHQKLLQQLKIETGIGDDNDEGN